MRGKVDKLEFLNAVSQSIKRISPGRSRLVMGSWPGGRTPHIKGVGMLVVSLRGVNFGFWSHLRCSGQNANIYSREGLV